MACCVTWRGSLTGCMRPSAGRRPDRAAAGGLAAPNLLLDSERAVVDGTTRLQPVVSAVRRLGDGRTSLDPNGVHEKSRPSAQPGDRPQLLSSGVERATDMMSDEHFTVDGTLIEAWATQKSFQRKDGGTDGDAQFPVPGTEERH